MSFYFGQGTISLGRLGAKVTDLSGKAIESVGQIAEETGSDAHFLSVVVFTIRQLIWTSGLTLFIQAMEQLVGYY